MKNLKLENFGVQEMDAKEIITIDGGVGFWDGVLLAGGLICQAFYDIGKYDGAHLK